MTGTAEQNPQAPDDVPELSVVMPCLNEEESVRWCVERAWRGIEQTGLRGEVVVCDNGSVDRSVEVAQRAGARVVHEARRGYGRAYRTGIEASIGRLIVIGDSDCSYDFLELHKLVGLLETNDYVLGSRFRGTILPGAMPFLNRYVGNPLLTATLNRLFGLHTSDAHSGMRAFTRSAYDQMQLECDGMEFASEIVIAAARVGLRVSEVPIIYHPRTGETKLHRWRDGFRHLRFMFGEALSPRPRGLTGSARSGDAAALEATGEDGAELDREEVLAGQPAGFDGPSPNGGLDRATGPAGARGRATTSSEQATKPADSGPTDRDAGSSVKLTQK